MKSKSVEATPRTAGPAGAFPLRLLIPTGSASSHAEPHLVGQLVTVVYRIEDPTEWRKTNPLKYAHDGMKAVGVSIGDLMQRRDDLREALEKITNGMAYEAHDIAQRALDKDDSLG